MLKFVTKREYWSLVDDGVEEPLRKGVFPWHLKTIQDAIAFGMIKDRQGLDVAEIGGGDSRILPAMAEHNTCFNIEVFEGRDGGPDEEITFAGVQNILALVGESHDKIADNSFDVVFSVSVVEHVPTDGLQAFISDCHRMLRPGGTMIHLVDMYLTQRPTPHNVNRIAQYTSAFDGVRFDPLSPIEIDAGHLNFDVSFATNPDSMMQVWNQVVPELRGTREASQSVAIAWAGTAI